MMEESLVSPFSLDTSSLKARRQGRLIGSMEEPLTVVLPWAATVSRIQATYLVRW
jgi:hypothetical protein